MTTDRARLVEEYVAACHFFLQCRPACFPSLVGPKKRDCWSHEIDDRLETEWQKVCSIKSLLDKLKNAVSKQHYEDANSIRIQLDSLQTELIMIWVELAETFK